MHLSDPAHDVLAAGMQAIMEAILEELLNTALSPQISADPATGTERLTASHSKEIHRVPYYQLAAQAEQRLEQQQQQSRQALHEQATAAAAASEAAVAALREHHQTEVRLCKFHQIIKIVWLYDSA